MTDLFTSPWPWYIGGPLIGLMVPLLLILVNRHFGISSSLDELCGYGGRNFQWRQYLRGGQSWGLLFVAGVLVGSGLLHWLDGEPHNVDISEGTIAALKEIGISDFSGMLPAEWFSWEHLSSVHGIVMMVVGGLMVGFGTRYAGGCASGHSIMGLSLLNLGSLVATLGFFAGGLLMIHLIYPLIF